MELKSIFLWEGGIITVTLKFIAKHLISTDTTLLAKLLIMIINVNLMEKIKILIISQIQLQKNH